jgi:hypothetical protein
VPPATGPAPTQPSQPAQKPAEKPIKTIELSSAVVAFCYFFIKIFSSF